MDRQLARTSFIPSNATSSRAEVRHLSPPTLHSGWFSHLECHKDFAPRSLFNCLKECLSKKRFAKLAQLSRTAVTRLYNSSGVELITHASVAVLQSLILEQTDLPAKLCFLLILFL